MKTATMLDARVGKYFVRCEEHNAEMVKQTLVKNSIGILDSETAKGYTGLIVEDTQESRILNEFRDGHPNVGILEGFITHTHIFGKTITSYVLSQINIYLLCFYNYFLYCVI